MRISQRLAHASIPGFLLLQTAVSSGDDNGIRPPDERNKPASEESRNLYLEEEKEQIRNSLRELDRRGFVVTPTPKDITFGKDALETSPERLSGKARIFPGNSSSAAEKYLQRRLSELGVTAVIDYGPSEGIDSAAETVSFLLYGPQSAAAAKYTPPPSPNAPQGHTVKTVRDGKAMIYCLAGNDKDGLLYAAVTLSKLITKNKGQVLFPDVRISDWPDVSHRCTGSLEWPFRRRFWENKTQDSAEGRQYVDWAVAHKINMLWGVSSDDPYSCIGDPKFRTPAMRAWLREVNTYAKERGVRVILPQSFAIGVSKDDKGKEEFKGCIDHRGGLFCWSRDKLMDKKIVELNDFIAETEYTGVYFHSLDTRNSRWEDRCENCRKRFGDDRIAGDANIINHICQGIKAKHPYITLIFVPRPYFGNLAEPEKLIKKGELKNEDDMLRFSEMIPEDIYLIRRECNRKEYLEWKKVMRQPVMLYQSNGAEGIRRLLTPTFACAKTYFTPLDKDIFWYCAGWPEDNISNIGSAEYSWNLNAPGSLCYDVSDSYSEDKTPSRGIKDTWDPFGPDKSGNKDLQDHIKRFCADLYGVKEAPFFYKTFISFADWNLIFDHKTLISELKKHGFKCSEREVLDWIKRTCSDSEAAISDLETLMKSGSGDGQTRMAVTYYLSKLYLIRAGAYPLSLAFEADMFSKEKDFSKANELIVKAFDAFDNETEVLTNRWPPLLKSPSFKVTPTLQAAMASLNIIKSGLDLIKVKVESRKQMSPLKKSSQSGQQSKPLETVSVIKAALFNPQNGKVCGANGLLQTLKTNPDIHITEISDLSLKTLKEYDCLVFPDCKNFGSSNVSASDIRRYVSDHGGGVYFEHDSCGFSRFPLQASVFPEIAEAGTQTGTHMSDSQYKPEERDFVISSSHPVTEGNERNLKFRQVYFDHFQLKPGDLGVTVLEDCHRKPVLVCGSAGKGRTVFYGAITYGDSDSELKTPLRSVEGEIITNAVRWLAKKEGVSIRTPDMRKKDEVRSDATYSTITFTAEIETPIPLHDVKLNARCFNAENLVPLSDETELCKPGDIDKKWRAEDTLTVRVPEREIIKLSLVLRSKEGVRTKNIILKN